MRHKRAWRRVVTASLVILATAVWTPITGFASSAVCASQKELTALEARVLQTELMVGALTCGQHDSYNTFVRTFKGDLVQHGKTLRALFKRAYGGGAKRQLNRFVTKLANDSSQRSNSARQGYCILAAELFDESTQPPRKSLEQLIDKPWIRSKHGFRPCS